MDVEREIRERIKNDDISVLELIYQRFGKKIFTYLVSLLCSKEKAEEVMQEVFVRIAQKRRKLLKARNMESYIFILARNQAMEYLRQQPRGMASLEDYQNILAVNNPSTFSEAERKEIEQALFSLPIEQREIIMMKIFENYSLSEIAHKLHLSRNTVWARYRYGMKKLKVSLKEFKDAL